MLPRISLWSLLLATTLPSLATAQIRASERALLAQTIDGTTLTLDFARPRVRGRDSIFGGQVYWTGTVQCNVESAFFGSTPTEVMALMKNGRVVKWVYTGSKEDVQ